MTSPNINIVILIGTTLGYVSVVLLGIDATVTDQVNFDAAVQVRIAQHCTSVVSVILTALMKKLQHISLSFKL